jgi:hypothetical protein
MSEHRMETLLIEVHRARTVDLPALRTILGRDSVSA